MSVEQAGRRDMQHWCGRHRPDQTVGQETSSYITVRGQIQASGRISLLLRWGLMLPRKTRGENGR